MARWSGPVIVAFIGRDAGRWIGVTKKRGFLIPCKHRKLRGSFCADWSFGEEKGDRLLSEELEEISFGMGRGLAVDRRFGMSILLIGIELGINAIVRGGARLWMNEADENGLLSADRPETSEPTQQPFQGLSTIWTAIPPWKDSPPRQHKKAHRRSTASVIDTKTTKQRSPERTVGPEKLGFWKFLNSEVPKKSGKSACYRKRGGSEVA